MISVTPTIYGKLLAYNELGLKPSEIARRMKCSPRTVRYWLAKKAGPEACRKRKVSVSHSLTRRRQLVKKYVGQKRTRTAVRYTPVFRKPRYQEVVVYPHHNPANIARVLNRDHGIKCSKSTVRRDLLRMGYVPRRRRRAPQLTAKHKAERVNFAHKFLSHRSDLQEQVVYGDEKTFNDNQEQPEAIWLPRGKEAPPRRVEQGPHSLIVFIAIGIDFKFIHVLPNGSMTKDVFRAQVLDRLARLLRRTTHLLMVDNAPPHSGWQEYCRSKRVRVIPYKWPALSPDGNPEEQVNQWLEASVQKHAPWGCDELRDFILREFEAIPQEKINALCRTARSRWERIVKAKGETIKP